MPTLTPISTQPERAKVISLREGASKYRPGKCRHMNMTVDDELATVACDDCGEKLNPIAVLLRMAHEESRWGQRAAELQQALQRFSERERTKCQHCGHMTRISSR